VFTLRDLVSYADKHNEENGEDNADGDDHTHSWNCGVEGPTADPQVRSTRARQVRNLLTSLILSQGVPMICAGDELGRTQRGNNNAYCQDNEMSWLDWQKGQDERSLFELTRLLLQLRRQHPIFRRTRFFEGRAVDGATIEDLSWFRPTGESMRDEDWHAESGRALAMRLSGDSLTEIDADGNPVRDDTFLLLLNAGPKALQFTLPPHGAGHLWAGVVDTAGQDRWEGAPVREPSYRLEGRSMAVLRAIGTLSEAAQERHEERP
jgi:glycogen operon protein